MGVMESKELGVINGPEGPGEKRLLRSAKLNSYNVERDVCLYIIEADAGWAILRNREGRKLTLDIIVENTKLTLLSLWTEIESAALWCPDGRGVSSRLVSVRLNVSSLLSCLIICWYNKTKIN